MPTANLIRRRKTILISINDAGERRFITLPVKIQNTKHWNASKSQVSKKEPDFLRINEYLADSLTKARIAVSERVRNGYFDIDILKAAAHEAIFGGAFAAPDSFNDYVREIIASHIDHKRYERAETLETIAKNLDAFAADQNRASIRFVELSPRFVRLFSSFLASEYENGHNTRVKKLKALKAIVNSAIRDGYIKGNAGVFEGIPLVEKKAEKVRLTRAELGRLEKLDLKAGSAIWHARNFFCMQVYLAGTRVSDVCALKWESVKEDRINIRQIKTDVDVDIAISNSARRILAFYDDRREAGKKYVFPHLDEEDVSDKFSEMKARDRVRAKINKQLKLLAQLAGINKKITSHVARHTFADLARKSGKDIFLISKALGHKSIQQTQVYLASFDSEGVDNMLNDLF